MKVIVSRPSDITTFEASCCRASDCRPRTLSISAPGAFARKYHQVERQQMRDQPTLQGRRSPRDPIRNDDQALAKARGRPAIMNDQRHRQRQPAHARHAARAC